MKTIWNKIKIVNDSLFMIIANVALSVAVLYFSNQFMYWKNTAINYKHDATYYEEKYRESLKTNYNLIEFYENKYSNY